MKWVDQFQLFLFDFDGLLVDNERLHLKAYTHMCRSHGFELTWDISRFFAAAHLNSTGLRDAIYAEFPSLYSKEPNWEILYAEKKAAYLALIRSGKLTLMPGVKRLLEILEKQNIHRCVATNSPKEHIELIKDQLPILFTIPLWVTREDYQHSKPQPDAYLKALEKIGKTQERTIGFEDSLKGFTALKRADCQVPVLICPSFHPQLKSFCQSTQRHFESFESIPDDFVF